MQRREVVSRRHTTAGIDAVWALASRARTYKDWASFTVSTLEREGDPAPDGVGAIRRFGFPIYKSREQVLEFDPPTHFAYTLLSGLPLRDYRADVTLAAAGTGGTDIEWRSSFVPPWPGSGWFWAAFLRFTLNDFTKRLAKAAARQP